MSSIVMSDSHARLADRFAGRVQITTGFEPRPNIQHVVFDFDGTLSLVREGWPEVMVPMFEELLPEAEGDTSESVRQMLLDDIMTLNGKQTIYQMIRFAERVADRGGTPEDPLEYKHEYLRRLEKRINSRVAGLQRGEVSPNQYLLHGSLDLLNALKSRGMQLYLASGTDEVYVKREAKLLGVAEHFGEHIHGALDDYKSFSKRHGVWKNFCSRPVPHEYVPQNVRPLQVTSPPASHTLRPCRSRDTTAFRATSAHSANQASRATNIDSEKPRLAANLRPSS